MSKISHSAKGPALGYYYQAVFALICLFDSKNSSAFISIETFDDVYHEDGTQKTLHQLKHSINPDTKISLKSDELWKTLKVWCDFIKVNDPNDGIFTLSTVATIDSLSILNVLTNITEDRTDLEKELLQEAKRIIGERELIRKQNIASLKAGQKEKALPYENRYKGCEAFLNIGEVKRRQLIKNIRLNTDSFSISEAQDEVIKRVKIGTQLKNCVALSERIIAWWDREAVRSLTKERDECIFFSELQEFIAMKSAELYNDGFTDDIDDIELPPPDTFHSIHLKQLEIIDATVAQKRRSFNTEVKARIQREIWIKDNLPAAAKLKKYDENLIDEWSYKFEEMKEQSTDILEDKKFEGRKLLDWSHENAHQQIKSISQKYSNPDLTRGSYQMLSKDMRVGWHCDFDSLIN